MILIKTKINFYFFVLMFTFFNLNKTNAEVGIEDPLAPVFQSYIMHSVDPYNEEKLEQLLTLVNNNKSELEKTEQGQHLIKRARHARRAVAIKKKLDECFEDADDVTSLKQANKVMQEAMKLDGYSGHCQISESELDELTSYFSDFNNYLKRSENITARGTTQQLRRELFIDTSLKSSISEARLRHLISDETDVPSLLSTMCGEDLSGCPENYIQTYQALAQKEKDDLIEKGHRPLASAVVADNLESSRVSLYGTILNNETAPYHFASRDPELYTRVKNRFGSGLEIASVPAYMDSVAFLPSDLQMRSDDFRRLQQENAEDAYEKLQESSERAVLQAELSIPQSFYDKQDELVNDPYALAMATNSTWGHALGFAVEPSAEFSTNQGQNGAVIRFRSTGFGDQGKAVDLYSQSGLITENSVKENRDNALENLNNTLGEMGPGIFSPPNNEDQDDIIEDLSSLMVANPRAAAQALMNNPNLIAHYCDVFNDIKSDEDFNKWVGWGLLGAGVALVVFTGGMAAIAGAGGLTLGGVTVVSSGVATTATTIGSGALALSLVADITYLGSNAFSDLEIGRLQRAVCVNEGPNSDPCREFQDNLNSATNNFILAGVSGASGAGVFIKMISSGARSLSALARIAKNTEQITEIIRQNGPLRSIFARLSEEQSAALYAKLATMSEQELAGFLSKLNELNASQMDELIKSLRTNLTNNVENVSVSRLIDELPNSNPNPTRTIDYTSTADEIHPTFDMQRLWDLQRSDPAAAIRLEREIAETMSNGNYSVIRRLGGANGGATLVEFENGVRAVMKTGNTSEAVGPAMGFQIEMHLEEAAFAIDRQIGLGNVPPTILRNVDGEVTAFQFFAAGAEIGTGNANNLRMFDYLMGNTDRVSSGVRNNGNIINLNGRAVAIDNALHLRSRNSVTQGVPEFSTYNLDRAETSLKNAEEALARAQNRNVSIPGQIDRLTAEVNIARGRVIAQEGQLLQNAKSVMWDKSTYERFKATSEQEWTSLLAPPSGYFRHDTEMINFLHHRRDLIRTIDELRVRFGDEIFP